MSMISDDAQCIFLTRRWHNGESILPLVQRLLEHNCPDEAAAAARLALLDPECLDRDELESALRRIANEPAGWSEALAEFAKKPSEERWDELMRFVDPEDMFHRLRTTVPLLARLGCEPNMLFRCAAKFGMSPDLINLAASGVVDPETIEERGAGSAARASWLGVAAQAAFARNDRFRTLRYLREAVSNPDDAYLAWGCIAEIRDRADEAFNAELDKLDIPRV